MRRHNVHEIADEPWFARTLRNLMTDILGEEPIRVTLTDKYSIEIDKGNLFNWFFERASVCVGTCFSL